MSCTHTNGILGESMKTKLLILFIFSTGLVQANPVLPLDPSQNIAYWRPHVIKPSDDALVAKAQKIYQRLARAWDQTRLTPALHIIRSSAGPWAASLQDGNILLSRKAVEVCFKYKNKSADLLAFILAHEMAHMRSNDLWHQQFFRLVGSQAPAVQKRLAQGIKNDIDNLERREAQADHDGIILMSTVGFDPFQIIDNKDFFTIWVENIWRHSCSYIAKQNHEKQACDKAKTRALRTKAQLKRALGQAVLYELGIQSLVAKDFSKAQDYLQAFARDFPSRSVFETLGLSHLIQAKEIHSQLIKQDLLVGVDFFFPFALSSHAFQFSKNNRSEVRGNQILKKRLLLQLKQHGQAAIDYFEKSRKIDPDYKANYLYLALSYLLTNNNYMTRGIIQGQYEKRFSADISSQLVLALTYAFEGKYQAAIKEHHKLTHQTRNIQSQHSWSRELIIYTLLRNYTALLQLNNQQAKAKQTWQTLAKQEQKSSSSVLFELALGHLLKQKRQFTAKQHPLIRDHRIGDILTHSAEHRRSEIWLNGDKLHLLRFESGAQLLVNGNRVINAWQTVNAKVNLFKKIKTGMLAKQSIRLLGLPSRHMNLTGGQYLAYDDIGVAIQIVENKVAGWFLYENQK